MNYRSAADWPDWRGETAIVIATGPSAADEYLAKTKGHARIIAIKTSWHLVPWADVLYGSDRAWWFENSGAPQFGGLKLSPSPMVCAIYSDVRQIELVRRAEILTDEVGKVGCGLRSGGGHSGFHAINLAVQFGVKRIVLVGFDMNFERGQHWCMSQPGMRSIMDVKVMDECRHALDACAPQLERLGIDVINASLGSSLTAYRKANLIEALAA